MMKLIFQVEFTVILVWTVFGLSVKRESASPLPFNSPTRINFLL